MQLDEVVLCTFGDGATLQLANRVDHLPDGAGEICGEFCIKFAFLIRMLTKVLNRLQSEFVEWRTGRFANIEHMFWGHSSMKNFKN